MDLEPEKPQPSKFYDGGLPPGEPRPDLPVKVMLERIEKPSGRKQRESFLLLRRIAYRDDVYGEILVPADPATFETDFTSVPTLFTWLVPKTGAHLPAALIHDGMVGAHDYVATGYPPGQDPIDRVAADAIFRRAMRDSMIGPIRQWLVWSAVTLGTIWGGSTAWSTTRHWRYRIAALASILVVVALGVIATLDLFDVVAWLPWMGEGRSFAVELVGGLAGAVVVPLLLGLTWGRFAVAGVVSCVALAVLLHVTVLLGLISVAYLGAEWVARRKPVAMIVLAGVVIAAHLVLVLLFL
ncbi:DUF1353 domain-containing protein [Nocardioides sp. WS12]|uniref:DUF1353 domain-containing protein n=1 Tax=Nocardioides sp. WS12 TaxID=2486272 RepID=UPI0015FAF0CD|nr:DUF1353 domain-containing protein [Nocardioides sp. WS12]